MPEISIFLSDITHVNDAVSQLIGHLPIDGTLIAQNVSDPNILGRIQQWFSNFVATGQIWAMLIGLVIGYLLRNLTSYS